MTESPISMTEPNAQIGVYEGIYELTDNVESYFINGKLTYDWFPSPGIRFSGFEESNSQKFSQFYASANSLDIKIEGLFFSKGFVTKMILTDAAYVEGTSTGYSVLGDKSIEVEKMVFAIPNLKEFLGMAVETSNGYSKSRLVFDNNDFQITIDKLTDFQELKSKLDRKGGYIVLYVGELTKKKGTISLEKTEEIIHSFSTFLNFLNGRRCSPLFRTGFCEGDSIWCNYTNYHVDQYKNVNSWSPSFLIEGLNGLWQEFNSLWMNAEHKPFVVGIVHWYTEANLQSGLTDGAIIMAQTGLELIYNWLLVEQKRFIIGQDAMNLSAANKIRLILSVLNVSNEVPLSLIEFNKFVKEDSDIQDAPDGFVQIRNAIVHSNMAKRKKIADLSDMVKYEALQLGLWYIELSILYILKYKGHYKNRCRYTGFVSDEQVPWGITT